MTNGVRLTNNCITQIKKNTKEFRYSKSWFAEARVAYYRDYWRARGRQIAPEYNNINDPRTLLITW